MDAHMDLESSHVELGLLVLLVAQLLSSYMGIYVQDTYAKYGNHWQENLFYSHLISIPLFLPLQAMLRGQYERLRGSPPMQLPGHLAQYVPVAAQRLVMRVPTSMFHLAVNSLTQLGCISGVNLLGSRSSAVTVTIVLNIRKLASFILSIWLFGNKLSGLMVVGAVLVFGSGALYVWETSFRLKRRQASAEKKAS
jgi:drug/metabolite transporter (DMT)-like permease